MPFHMFVTDYDGTLLTSRRTLDPKDLQTLSQIQERGTVVCIATGRSLFSFVRSLEQLDMAPQELPVDYLIFSTGAGVMDLKNNRLLRTLDLGREDILKSCVYFDDLGFDYMIHKAIPHTPYFLYKSQSRNANPDFQARIDLYPEFATPLDKDTDLYETATEVLAIVPRAQMSLAQEDIQRDLDGASVIFATSPLDHESVWVEVFHPQVSKSRSVEWLCRRLGLGSDQVISVGNDYNDLDLLEWSGRGVVVSNAPQSMKNRFVQVGSNNHCGVSEAAVAAGLVMPPAARF